MRRLRDAMKWAYVPKYALQARVDAERFAVTMQALGFTAEQVERIDAELWRAAREVKGSSVAFVQGRRDSIVSFVTTGDDFDAVMAWCERLP